MKIVSHARILLLAGFVASFVLVAMLILAFAGSAVAGPQLDLMAYLPYVSNPPQRVDSYETEFTDNIEPWKAVRWQNGANYDIDHSSGCDDGHCGFLDVEVNTNDTYVVVSPLIQGPAAGYDITFRAKLNDRRDKAQYGVVYGGDWHSAPCPGTNTNGCFNHYYEFRVRYRDNNGEKYMEYRIRRVNGHDGNNIEQGEDLLEWTRATDVDPEGWNKWEVHYGSSGHMSVKANNQEQAGSARDNGYDDALFFGVYARAGENGDTEAIFDKFSIEKED